MKAALDPHRINGQNRSHV